MFDGLKKKDCPAGSHQQGSRVSSTHPRSGYPLSGCFPAEPDSVSPDARQYNARRGQCILRHLPVNMGLSELIVPEEPVE